MAALPYMQLYVADYLADTAHLNAAQHGAYLLLLMNYWQRGKALVNSNARLANVARMSNEEWNENRTVLEEFFEVTEEEWVHARVERDLEAVRGTSSRNSAAGKASANVRAAKRQRDSNERSTNVQPESNHTDTDTEQIQNRTSSSTLAPSSLELTATSTPEPVIGFLECLPGKAAGPTRWPVTQARARQWAKAYPAVNIPLELQRMRIWIEDNPKSRKTHDGMGNFCTRWLKQEQNKAGGNGNGNGSGRNGFQLFARPGDARSALEEYAEREQRGAEHSGSAGRTLAGTTGEDQRGCDRDVRASPAALLDR